MKVVKGRPLIHRPSVSRLCVAVKRGNGLQTARLMGDLPAAAQKADTIGTSLARVAPTLVPEPATMTLFAVLTGLTRRRRAT